MKSILLLYICVQQPITREAFFIWYNCWIFDLKNYCLLQNTGSQFSDHTSMYYGLPILWSWKILYSSIISRQLIVWVLINSQLWVYSLLFTSAQCSNNHTGNNGFVHFWSNASDNSQKSHFESSEDTSTTFLSMFLKKRKYAKRSFVMKVNI